MKTLLLLCMLLVGALTSLRGHYDVLDNQSLSNIKGSEILTGQGLDIKSCGNAPPYFVPEGLGCKSFTASVTGKIKGPYYEIWCTIGETYCTGGCIEICNSDANKRFCKSSCNNTCDTADTLACSGGTKYTSTNNCPLANTTNLGCAACNYAENGSNCDAGLT